MFKPLPLTKAFINRLNLTMACFEEAEADFRDKVKTTQLVFSIFDQEYHISRSVKSVEDLFKACIEASYQFGIDEGKKRKVEEVRRFIKDLTGIDHTEEQ